MTGGQRTSGAMGPPIKSEDDGEGGCRRDKSREKTPPPPPPYSRTAFHTSQTKAWPQFCAS